MKSVSSVTKFYSREHLANVATSFTKFITSLHYTSTISWQITTSVGTPVPLPCEASENALIGAVVCSNSDPKAVDSSYGERFAPCLQQIPPRI